MRNNILFTLLVLTLLCAPLCTTYAQEMDSVKENKINTKRLALVIGAESAFYVGGMLYLSEVWYRDYERVPFHFYNDNAGWLQMDKYAHAYIAYQESRAGYHLLRWSGVNKKNALIFGGTLGFVLQLPVEIFDGLYEGYGFSMGDVAANAFGSALFIAQEWAWDSQPVKMKFSFYPSSYSQYRPRTLGENLLENLVMDYNAQTYWFSFNMNHFFPGLSLPPWFNLALGYSANGMLGEFENPRFAAGRALPELERYRQYLFSIDIDLSLIPTRSKALKAVFEAVNLLKIPAPTLQINRIDGARFHWIYY